MSRPRGAQGFTLVEVVVVSVILGILAGIAVPALGRQIDRAAATKVVADARIIEVATRSFVEAGGTLPPSGNWGEAPVALSAYLEEEMSFSYRDAEYRIVTLPASSQAELWVRYPEGSGLGGALLGHRNPPRITWTPTRTTFQLVD